MHFFVTTEVLREKKRHFLLVLGYLQSRTKYSAYSCRMRDIEVHAEEKLIYYIRMDLSTFEELFCLVELMIRFVQDMSVVSVCLLDGVWH